MDRPRGLAFYLLAGVFALYVLFLYGPTLTILALSFQGPSGGLTFPMNGVSTHWFAKLWEASAWSTSGRLCGAPWPSASW